MSGHLRYIPLSFAFGFFMSFLQDKTVQLYLITAIIPSITGLSALVVYGTARKRFGYDLN